MTTPGEVIGRFEMADEEADLARSVDALAATQEEDGAAPAAIGPVATGVQLEILNFIAEHIDLFGWAPTVREICERTGLRSTSTVHHHLRRLEELGLIVRGSRQSRATSVGRAAA